MGPDTARALERELDQVAPLFTDAVMDDDADFDLEEAFACPTSYRRYACRRAGSSWRRWLAALP